MSYHICLRFNSSHLLIFPIFILLGALNATYSLVCCPLCHQTRRQWFPRWRLSHHGRCCVVCRFYNPMPVFQECLSHKLQSTQSVSQKPVPLPFPTFCPPQTMPFIKPSPSPRQPLLTLLPWPLIECIVPCHATASFLAWFGKLPSTDKASLRCLPHLILRLHTHPVLGSQATIRRKKTTKVRCGQWGAVVVGSKGMW